MFVKFFFFFEIKNFMEINIFFNGIFITRVGVILFWVGRRFSVVGLEGIWVVFWVFGLFCGLV